MTGATLKRMPDASAFETRNLQWTDALRPDGPREVLARFYLPAVIKGSEKATSSQQFRWWFFPTVLVARVTATPTLANTLQPMILLLYTCSMREVTAACGLVTRCK